MIYKEYDPGTYELKSDVKKEVVFSQDFNYDKLLFENYIPFMCLLFGRDPLVSSGGFDKGFDLYEDWDLLIRIGNYILMFFLVSISGFHTKRKCV